MAHFSILGRVRQYATLCLGTLCLLIISGQAYALHNWYGDRLGSDQVGNTFHQPVFNGHRVAWCRFAEHECGRAAANAFCRTKGFRYAGTLRRAYNAGQTRFIGTGEVCHKAHCDGFRFIRCIGEAAYTERRVHGLVVGKTRVFHYPMHNHHRVDFCLKNHHDCGKPAANAYCQSRGFKRASRYRMQHNIGKTQSISDGQLCLSPKCDGFRWIRCCG